MDLINREIFMSTLKQKVVKSLMAASLITSSLAGFAADKPVYSVVLDPNKPESLYSILPWDVYLRCKVETDEPQIALDMTLISGSTSSINYEKIRKGEHRVFYAINNQSFEIRAGANANVNITKVKASENIENNSPAKIGCTWMSG